MISVVQSDLSDGTGEGAVEISIVSKHFACGLVKGPVKNVVFTNENTVVHVAFIGRFTVSHVEIVGDALRKCHIIAKTMCRPLFLGDAFPSIFEQLIFELDVYCVELTCHFVVV